MDTLRGNFDSSDLSDESRDYDVSDDDAGRDLPPASIGQDERRMQVRAYNFWAGMLDDRNYPSIEDLEPESIDDFGPYSVLLDFSEGIDDPIVQFLGGELAKECGSNGVIRKLSDVPPRSLLSRITDHYMQILANQAPIGFEAEFVNQAGNTVLYRGILLPYSSDDDTIDFIYGVINWKEMASAAAADELLLEIDQALETDGGDVATDELDSVEADDEAEVRHSLPVTDWADGPGFDDEAEVEAVLADDADGFAEPADEGNIEPLELTSDDEFEGEDDMPSPAFGDYSLDDEAYEEDYDEEEEANYSFASLTDHIKAPINKTPAIDLESLQASVEYDEDSFDGEYEEEGYREAATSPAPMPQAYEPEPVEPEVEYDIEAVAEFETGDEVEDFAEETFDEPEVDDATYELEDSAIVEEEEQPEAPVEAAVAVELPAAEEVEPAVEELPADSDLFDCLASARELAHTARSCEDRSRSALYAAVGRAYDFSLAAQESPAEYDALVVENGLSVQDRAPMTPVVKLVFGSDYDKTRLTEYAAVLSHAHRVGIERGKLASYLSEAEGGLKGVVTAERRMRKEEAGKPVDPVDEPRASLARKLRKLDHFSLEDLSAEGPEFALVMIRRTEDGQIAVLGEIDDDIPLIERVGRMLVG